MFHVKRKGDIKMNEYTWARYKLYCYNRGLAEGNYKNLHEFMKTYIHMIK